MSVCMLLCVVCMYIMSHSLHFITFYLPRGLAALASVLLCFVFIYIYIYRERDIRERENVRT